jgi:hypothetical protein
MTLSKTDTFPVETSPLPQTNTLAAGFASTSDSGKKSERTSQSEALSIIDASFDSFVKQTTERGYRRSENAVKVWDLQVDRLVLKAQL